MTLSPFLFGCAVTILYFSHLYNCQVNQSKKLIIDTDIFSDVDDTGALLLASTFPSVDLLAVNVNYPSSYSALAASAILGHYGLSRVPVGLRRPFMNATFFDSWGYRLGEFASKVAYNWRHDSCLPWGGAEEAWEPVKLYRKVLAEQENKSVTIASIGFLENLSALLNSTSDSYSMLSGPALVAAKVSELVVMGGGYPTGYEFNFYSDNPAATAHVVNTWPGPMTFSGTELGQNVFSGAQLTVEGPEDDPVRAAYKWYTGYNASRNSWDPLTVLYAIAGFGDLFVFGNAGGHNFVYSNGSNVWLPESKENPQHWLKLLVSNTTAGAVLDQLFLDGARRKSSLRGVGRDGDYPYGAQGTLKHGNICGLDR